MQFQKIDLRAALQILADFSGVNLVLADSVSGSLSLRLQDVPWDQALHTILQSKALGQQREGNVIWVAPLSELAVRDKQQLEAKAAVQVLEPLQTQAFSLNYAKALDMLKKMPIVTPSSVRIKIRSIRIQQKKRDSE